MTDTSGEQGSATLDLLASRLDELTREVRRQGRAAVAAQAAAESCLEKVAALEEAGTGGKSEPDGEDADEDTARGASPARTDWVRAILPVADALDRMVAQANAMVERPPPAPAPAPPRRGLFSLFSPPPPAPPPPARDTELRVLAEGLRVLRAQLTSALEACDVHADRRTGVAIDPEVHRVVEVRPLRAGERADVVLEVVRPGYAAGDQIVREAEVVAGERRSSGDGAPPPRA